MIKVRLTRDPVCAGDDADAQYEQFAEADSAPLDVIHVMKFVRALADRYLPSVNGVGRCWSAFLNGKFIATVTVTGGSLHVDKLALKAENELYFKYHSANY